jgi:hypothetical protein
MERGEKTAKAMREKYMILSRTRTEIFNSPLNTVPYPYTL